MSTKTVHKGWVERGGTVWLRATNAWCVLTANPAELQLYSDEAETVAVGSSISLRERQMSSSQNSVFVKDRMKLIHKFKGRSQQDAEAWVKHIQLAVRSHLVA